MIVAELMTPKPVTVAPSDTLEAAHERMEAGRFRQVPVVDKERLVGILTDRDTRQYLGQSARTRVDAVMSAHPFSVHPSTPVEKAAHLIITNKIGSLPVVEDGKLVGIITATDMLRALEAILGDTSEGSSRIDLDLEGSGEIEAATSLVRAICPLLGVGTYQRKRNHPEHEVLFVLVPSTSAQSAAHALKEYGFKVLAVHN
ncbi:MAG: CBS domain-containing protein [Candidatus Binatus sp.]|uniref:CBS domain-containing protein n=1 Tax=Candidatus Binatus sp. TaxID=2811406 RepID=UPI003C75948B